MTSSTDSPEVPPAAEPAEGSNFYFSFLFLPPEKRAALFAVYAFCREVDDLVDEPRPGIDPRAELAAWRERIAALYADPALVPEHAVAARLQAAVARFPLPRQAFLDILDGVEMDLISARYATWEELQGYCRRVASAVGLLAIEVFGYRNPASRDYAVDLGLALQLTNIVRDVGSDAERGRIYLPAEDLDRFEVPVADLLARRDSPALRRLLAFECQRARGLYFRAEATLPAEDRMSLFAAEIMGRIYYRILERIERGGFDVLGRRHSLPVLQKAWIAFGIWLKYKILGGS
jgi:phytoene synthase